MNPPVQMAPASVEGRIGAYLVDVGVGVAIPLMLVSMVTGATFGVRAITGSTASWPAFLTPALLVISSLAWTLVYTAMQGGTGSIGQRVTGLRLADVTTGA